MVGCAAVLFGVLMEDGVHPFAAVPLVVLFGVGGRAWATGCSSPAEAPAVPGHAVRHVRLSRGGAAARRHRSAAPQVVECPPGIRRALLKRSRYVLVGKDATGALVFPAMFVLCWCSRPSVGFFLHRTAYGRYWYAIGHNELAAKYAGVNVNRQRVVGVRDLFGAGRARRGAAVPRHAVDPVGQRRRVLELYAILGAVLGGCSLRAARGRRSAWCSGRWCCRCWKPRELSRASEAT